MGSEDAGREGRKTAWLLNTSDERGRNSWRRSFGETCPQHGQPPLCMQPIFAMNAGFGMLRGLCTIILLRDRRQGAEPGSNCSCRRHWRRHCPSWLLPGSNHSHQCQSKCKMVLLTTSNINMARMLN